VPAGFAVGASAETDALSFVVSPGGVVVIGSGTELASNTAGADPAIDS
jgi:hypothetical protein